MFVPEKPSTLPHDVDVADDRALLLALLRRRLADVEARVAVVVRLGVAHLAALGVEGVDAVDATALGDEVRERVAVDVDGEEAVGLVVAGVEALDGHPVGVVDEHAVLVLAALEALAVELDVVRPLGVADQLEPVVAAADDLHALACTCPA